MPATVLPWTQYTEPVVGHGHPTLTDVDNRPLRQFLTSCGVNPDATFGGFVPVYNAKAYGAAGDGVTDDSTAIQGAVNDAQDVGVVYLPSGTFINNTPINYPAGHRTLIVGSSSGNTTLKGAGVTASHSHLAAEWYSGALNFTIDGAGAATQALLVSRTSLFRTNGLRITNAPVGMKILSSWDGMFWDTFISGTGGVVTLPFVMDTTSSEDCVQNRFFGFHVEPGDTNNVYVDLVGQASGKLRHNRWYWIKIDGVPGSSGPLNKQLLRIGANSLNNSFHGGDVSYGNGASQIQIAGNNNSLIDIEHVVGSTPPTWAVEVLSGANDNQIIGHQSVSSAFTSGLFTNAGSRTRFKHANFNPGITTALTDTGFDTDWDQPHVRKGFTVPGAGSSTPNPILGDGHDIVATGSTQTINAPTNPVDGMTLKVTIQNNSGGALTTTWNSVFKLAGAWVDPANGKRRAAIFQFLGYLPGWIELGRSAADI